MHAALQSGELDQIVEEVCKHLPGMPEVKRIPGLIDRQSKAGEIEMHTEQFLALLYHLRVYPQITAWLEEVLATAVLTDKFKQLGIQDLLSLVAQ